MGILAGRDDELDLLVAAARAALSGSHTTCLLVTGDPGVGKSALLDAAVALLDHQPVIRLTGYAAERTVPLAAARELLHLVSEHEGLETPVGVLADPAGISERAYQAVASRVPLLLVVDDLQWIDPLTIGVLHYAIRGASAAGLPLATLVASRRANKAVDFHDSLRRAVPEERVSLTELGPLSRAAGISVARAADPRLDDDRAAQLWERARGSPFWMQALLRDRGTSSIRDLVIRRLHRCGPDGHRLASMLALVTRPLSRHDASEILAWPVVRIDGAASELAELGVAVLEGQRLHLVHDLVRDALTASLAKAERVELHARIGEWLEGIGEHDPSALVEALTHVREAGRDASQLALRIASSSGRRLLDPEVLRELAHVADDLPCGVGTTDQLNVAIGRVAGEVGDQELALTRWSSVLDHSTEPAVRDIAALEAAHAAAALERPAEARRFLQAVGAMGGRGSASHVRKLALEASLVEAYEHRPDEARVLIDEAIRLARAWKQPNGSLSPEASAAYLEALTTSMALTKMGDDESGLAQLAEEAVAVARHVGDLEHLGAALRMATVRSRTDIDVAVERVRSVWEEANRRALPTVELQAGFWLATLLADRGSIGEAEPVIDSVRLLSLRAATLEPKPNSVAFVASLIGISRGPWQPSLEAITSAAERRAEPHFHLRAWQHVARWEARLKGRAAAASVVCHVDAALSAAAAANCSRCARELRLGAAEALALVGEAHRAVPLLEEWDTHGNAAHPYWGLVRRRAGALVALVSDAPDGRTQLTAVLADGEALGLGLDALWDGLHLGRALAEVDRPRASEILRAVAAKANAGGARTEEALAEQALRRLGVRTWARQSASLGDDPLSALTEREREIACLIAAGASNPDIAARLFISRKTVERHVSNVLAKLGTRNRAQVAALVTRGAQSSEGVPVTAGEA